MAQTHIPRKYRHGFVLTEQDLRKLITVSTDQIKKRNTTCKTEFKCILKDHTTIDTKNIDDFFSIENSGLQSIITIKGKIFSEDEKETIYINFHDINRDENSYYSIQLDIFTEDRDWAFVTTADIEDRISRIKYFDFSLWWNNSIFSHIFIGLVTIFCLWYFNTHFSPSIEKSESLRIAYESGKIQNSVEALIFLEEQKEDKSAYWYLAFLVFISLGPITLSKLIEWLAKIVSKPYVFCWNEEIKSHEKRTNFLKTISITVILGGIVSLVVAFIAAKLGL